MARSKSPVNPFYVVLVMVGIAFCITACAYGIMTFRALRGEDDQKKAPILVALLDQHGERILMGEILLLGLATFGAIKTDRYWQSRGENGGKVTTEAQRHGEEGS